MFNKNSKLDDIIRRASEASAAASIRELTDEEMDRVHGGERIIKGRLGKGSTRAGCSGGTICTSTRWTDVNDPSSPCG